MSDLRLSDADEVLLESLVLSAADNVAKAESSKRANHAPTRRRAYVETDTDNVYLGTGSQWVDVSENTGILSALFAGGDLTANSVDTGSVTTDSASVTNQVDAGSVNTEVAQVGQNGGGEIFGFVEGKVGEPGDAQIQFTGLDRNYTYQLYYSGNVDEDVIVRFNGDGPSTGNYAYWDSSATIRGGQNGFALLRASLPVSFAGVVTFREAGDGSKVGLNNQLFPTTMGRIDNFAREGQWDENTNPIDTVEIICNGGLEGDEFELWRQEQ